jgi:hypothetical protein
LKLELFSPLVFALHWINAKEKNGRTMTNLYTATRNLEFTSKPIVFLPKSPFSNVIGCAQKSNMAGATTDNRGIEECGV